MMNISQKLFCTLVATAAATAALSAAPASAQTQVLVSGGYAGQTTAGQQTGTGNAGNETDVYQGVYANGVFTTAAGARTAVVVNPYSSYSTLTGPGGTVNWISTATDGLADGYAASQPLRANGSGYDYLFSTTFTVTTPGVYQISGTFLSDNNVLAAYVQRDGIFTPIFDQTNQVNLHPNGDQDQNAPTSFQQVATFGPANFSGHQNYTLDFIVHNQNGNTSYNPIALSYRANIAAVPEPGSVASFAFGGVGLLGLMIRARKSRRAA